MWGALVECLVLFINIVLSSQVIISRCKNGTKHVYRQTTGISTGLSCGTQLANAFLIAFDLHMKQVFHESILLYRRFVDDVLIIAYDFDLHEFMSQANAWNTSIKITHDDTEQDNRTNFLDLTIEVMNNYIKCSTYRKPMNTYHYTPYNSSCAKHVKLGILESGFRRLLRTNLFQTDYDEQVQFFSERLRARAYPTEVIANYTLKFQWRHKNELLQTAHPSSKAAVVPLKLKFAHGLENIGIGAVLAQAASVLPSWFGEKHRFVVCYTAQPNLFRRRHARFL